VRDLRWVEHNGLLVARMDGDPIIDPQSCDRLHALMAGRRIPAGLEYGNGPVEASGGVRLVDGSNGPVQTILWRCDVARSAPYRHRFTTDREGWNR